MILKLEVKYDDLAERATYDVNRGSNGILLPTFYGHQKHPNLQRHRGGHSKKLYNKVKDLVEPIYEEYEDENPCDDPLARKNILGDLTGAENTARSNIESIAWELYKHSKRLFDGDYRDEGLGELSLDQPPITNKASGVRWLRDKANDIKRRYKIVNGKEVVKTEFYSDEGYPVPANPRA